MYYVSRREAACLLLLATSSLWMTAASPAAAENAPVAIKGYDPVAYFTLAKPAIGLAEFAFEWDEQRYFFARADHRDMFKANPARYAPQFANYCAVALTRGELDEGNPEYWLVSDGKLYLFGKPIGPGLFQRNLAENVAKANENRWLVQKR
jgi:YHS domain-containing protein